jgi:multiple sugar transport system substrate-binding protein
MEHGKLLSIPFAIFPGLIYYNADLFDKAGLEYPPAEIGKKYVLDGKSVDWDWTTVAEIARRLTVDANGNNAKSLDFEANKIVQFGFIHQWDTITADLATFGGAPIVNEQGKVDIPAHWREAAHWLWNGLWQNHFIPSADYQRSDLLKLSQTSNPFASGGVAIARTMLWYTCCLTELKSRWDLAIMPSYKGQIYAPAHADAFRIHKDTKHPDAAFKVLIYLNGEAAPELLKVYGRFPARPDLQESFIILLAEQHPSVKHWNVVTANLDYTVSPGTETSFPNYQQGQSRLRAFYDLIYSEAGKTIDLDQELDKLEADLQQIVNTKQK